MATLSHTRGLCKCLLAALTAKEMSGLVMTAMYTNAPIILLTVVASVSGNALSSVEGVDATGVATGIGVTLCSLQISWMYFLWSMVTVLP